MQNLTYLSLFSGIGGFELGLERCAANYRTHRTETPIPLRIPRTGNILLPDTQLENARCVGFSEIDQHAKAIYQHHFPTHTDLGDIRSINESRLPDFDLLCAGFPCQSFSIAGSRQGLGDERGELFFDMARIIDAKHPRLILLENVRGFLTNAHGATALRCFQILDDLGYDLQWQVLNCKDLGLPQNRERIYIVGHLRGEPRPQVFPFTHAAAQTPHRNPDTPRDDGKGFTLRRLTPLECERVQGFPDQWTAGVADTHRYAAIGNSVSPPVVEAILGRLFGLAP